MAWVVDGGAILGLAGAAALLLFGARMTLLGRTVGPGLVLGAFALIWGAQIVLIRIWAMDPANGRPFALASLAFALPLHLLVAHFAATFPTPIAATRSRWWLPALALPATAWLALVALDPRAGLQQPLPIRVVWGWATLLMVAVPLVAAMVFALARFARAYLAASEPRERAQLGLCAGAILLYLGYWLPWQAVFAQATWPSLLASYGFAFTLAYHGAIAVGLVGAVAIAALLVARTRGRTRIAWLAALGLPAATAVATGFADAQGGVLGLWRIALVGALAYAVAKYNLLDADLRLRSGTRAGLAAAVGLAVWGTLALAAWYATGVRWPDQPLPFVATLVAGGLAAGLSWRPLGRVVDRQFPYIRATEEYLLRRRIEVYRAALEAGAPDARRDRLARDLGLKGTERRIVERGFAGSPPTMDYAQGLGAGGRYAVERVLAQGAYGPVLLARDTRLGQAVVIKEFRGFAGPEAGRSFAREAMVAGSLDHPGVVRILDVFSAGGDFFAVLEHADGGNLEEALAKRSGIMPQDEALALVEPVLAALAEAHKRGIVHRDLKPSNVLFAGGKPKLADFGVAIAPALDGALRASRAQPGTVGWMAPEQARGDGASPASDVYAAGALLYRLLAGEHYLKLTGLTEQGARRAVVLRAPRLPVAGVTDAVNEVLATAMRKDPALRYADAGAMLRALRKAQRARPALAAAPSARKARAVIRSFQDADGQA